MKTRFLCFILLTSSRILSAVTAHAADNSWTNTASGKWEDATKWSLVVAPTNTQSGIFITNAITKTVTIDATTTNSPTTMTISNLTVSALSATNTLALTNAGVAVPLRVVNTLTISAGGAMTVTNSAVVAEGTPATAGLAVDGNVSFTDSSFVATNTPGGRNLVVGNINFGRGQMTVAGGSLSVFTCLVGNLAGSQGTLTLAGGTNLFGNLFIGASANATGAVWMTGGVLAGSFPIIRVGNGGVGQMIVSNGSVQAWDVALRGPSSTLLIAGGTCEITASFQIPNTADSTGSVWVTGGQLTVTNATTSLSPNGLGQITVSNGMYLARDVSMTSGTLTIAGGTTVLSSNLIMAVGVGRTGTVWISAGKLVTTNASTTIGSQGFGQFTVSNGTWLAKSVVLGEGVFGQGTLSVFGGTNALVGPLTVGTAAPGTGTVWVTGGQLVVTNTPATVGIGSGFIVDGAVTITNGSSITVSNLSTVVGNAGSGSLTVLGSSLSVNDLSVGKLTGAAGTVTISGGTATFSSSVFVADGTNSVGALWISNARVVTTNSGNQLIVGNSGIGQMTVSNSTVLGNQLYASGPGGTITFVGGTNTFILFLAVGPAVNTTGSVWMTGSTLVLTSSSPSVVGNFGVGQMTVSNGALLATDLYVGRFAGSQGTFTMVGGTGTFGSSVFVANEANSVGALWISGSRVVATNVGNAVIIGNTGVGQMTVSNSTMLGGQLYAGGGAAGSRGTITFVGGTNTFVSLSVGPGAGATGAVWMTGGSLVVTGSVGSSVGNFGVGRMTLSNGTWLASDLSIARFPDARGTLTAVGGTAIVSSNLTIGDCDGVAIGFLKIAGANVFVTNAAHTAVLDVRSGTLELDSGMLVIDKLVITNACGHFVRTGGTLSITSTNLGAGLDADADGIPNGFDLDPLNAADASNDPDGDGFTNLQEFQAGTNPTNSASFFGITAITQVSTNILVTWMTGTNKTNALQRTAGSAGNFETNSFATIFSVTNTTGTTTNYLDVGAGTNVPAFYYRIRLVP